MWGYVNNIMFVPPFEAVSRSWEEISYRIYVCLVTHGAHIDYC
jgi:hypothetical protein